MRFRLCQWDLQYNRSFGHARTRQERLCRLCYAAGLGAHIEDEKHVLLECPSFTSLRAQFSDLPFDDGMLAVMTHDNQKCLATFVCKLKDAHTAAVDACDKGLMCSKCKLGDRRKDLLVCKGQCCRAFHFDCCTPTAGRPSSRTLWFCAECKRKRSLRSFAARTLQQP